MGRIIAGRLASRRVVFPGGSLTRPTSERVRESVFSQIVSWLGRTEQDPSLQLTHLRFLDLFAGSGAMGLEAYSRGAEVTWVERDPAVVKVIRHNLSHLGAQGRVHAMDVRRFLSGKPASYDIVWLDPPYEMASTTVEDFLALLDSGWLTESGIVLVERSSRSSEVEFPRGFRDVGQRRYGDTTIHHGKR